MAAIKKKLGQNKVGTSGLPIVIQFCPSVNLNETFQLSQQEVNAITKIQDSKDAQNFLFKTTIQINQCVSNLFISNLFYEKVNELLKRFLMKRCVSKKMWKLERRVRDKACQCKGVLFERVHVLFEKVRYSKRCVIEKVCYPKGACCSTKCVSTTKGVSNYTPWVAKTCVIQSCVN